MYPKRRFICRNWQRIAIGAPRWVNFAAVSPNKGAWHRTRSPAGALLAVPFVLSLLCSPAGATQPEAVPLTHPTVQVQVSDGKLSVHAKGVPLVSLLDEVQRQTGVSFVGAAGLRAPISVDFTERPLPEALREILRRVNHVLLWTTGSRRSPQVSRVVVLASDASAAGSEGRGDAVSAPKPRSSDRASTRALTQLASDSDASARRWALQSLSGRTDPDTIGAARGALDDPDPQVREQALSALAYTEGVALRDIEDVLAREKVADVRIAAIRLLGEMTDEGRTEVLARLVQDRDPAVRIAVVEAMSRQDHPMASDILRRAAQDTEPSVRMAALSAIAYDVPGESARTTVERALKDGDANVRAMAEELMDSLQDMDDADERG